MKDREETRRIVKLVAALMRGVINRVKADNRA